MQSSVDKNPRSADGRSGAPGEIRFGAFRYLPDQSILLKQGRRVRIGSRALSLLKVLAAHAGQFVSNEALIAAAWPNTTVEDTNLRVQMTALRRLLSEDGDVLRITNAPGRGYALTVAPGGWEGGDRLKYDEARAPKHALPTQLTSLVGRKDSVAIVLKRLAEGRLVSVVGPGGIGKTRVAIGACTQLIEEGFGQIFFVDLTPLSSGEFVASAVATTLLIDDAAKIAPIEKIAHALQQGRTLLVLDNCEHVVDAAAELSEELLRTVPELCMLATSREPLLVDGEVIVRLTGLSTPEHAVDTSTLQEALAFPAIQLFVERASAGADRLSFDNSDAPRLAEIARRLDGIPLAIELAAASVASLGVHGVAALLCHQLAALSAGRRTAPARQRTMWATLAWSYGKLSADEQMLLDCLSAFRSTFSLAGAQAVSLLPPEATTQLLSSLVAKSLVVVVDYRRTVTRFRLLETTRGFAEEKLEERKESADVRRRHAAHFVSLFAAERTGAQTDPSMDRREESRARLDDVRFAITWCLSPVGDTRLGMRLIVDSAPMWVSLSILREYVAVVDGAVARLWRDPTIDAKDAMWLAPSLHLARFNTAGISAEMAPMLLRALELAEQEGDHGCQLACLWGLFGQRLTEARYKESLEFALRFADLGPQVADPVQRAVGHRAVGLAKWRNGDLAGARLHSDIALAAVEPNPASPLNQLLIYKQGAAARASASNLLWLVGFADQAVVQAAEAVAIGLEHDVLGLCYGLAQTIVPLAFWVGDLDQARAHTMLLTDLAGEHGLRFWLDWGRSYECALQRLASNSRHGADFIDSNAHSFGGLLRHILVTILGDTHGLVESIELPQTHWCTAELMRVAALGLLKDGDTLGAESMLTDALSIARGQGAFAWELRAATTLGELDLGNGQIQTARDRLMPVVKRATEGFETADFRRATALLAKMDAA